MNDRLIKGWMLAVLAAALVALNGCSLLPDEMEMLPPPLLEPVEDNIETAEVKRGEMVNVIKGTAIFQSKEMVFLYFSESGGKVKEVRSSPGMRVKKGDVLVQLVDPGIDIELEQRKVDVERRKIALKSLIRDQADEDQLRLAQMELNLAELMLQEAIRKQESRRLVAPMDGIVTFFNENLHPGMEVTAFQNLIGISNPNHLWLGYAMSSSTDLAAVHVGMEAELRYNDQYSVGKVVQTPSSAPETSDPNLADRYSRSLYIELDETPENAQIGHSVEFSIILERKQDALYVPRRAVREYMGRTYVQVLDGESRREVDVEVGITTATEIEIVSGLNEGQTVVLQ